jgi:hypothetical protein
MTIVGTALSLYLFWYGVMSVDVSSGLGLIFALLVTASIVVLLELTLYKVSPRALRIASCACRILFMTIASTVLFACLWLNYGVGVDALFGVGLIFGLPVTAGIVVILELVRWLCFHRQEENNIQARQAAKALENTAPAADSAGDATGEWNAP